MLYVDLDLISKWWGEEVHTLTVGALLRYAAQKDAIDICMPLELYVDTLMMFSKIPKGYRNTIGSPSIQIGGIRITGLLKEEAEKYKILK